MRKGKTKTVFLHGGPYDGQKLKISDHTHYTMVFSANGMMGRYVGTDLDAMYWDDLK